MHSMGSKFLEQRWEGYLGLDKREREREREGERERETGGQGHMNSEKSLR